MPVPADDSHKDVSRGDASMTNQYKEEYAASYEFGNTKVHVVAPAPMSREELQKRIKAHHNAGWAILREMQEKEANE